MSERVTWESCPSCGDRAAVGWTGDIVAEFDCVTGCELTEEQINTLRRLELGIQWGGQERRPG